MSFRSIMMTASFAALLCACSKECPALSGDRQWQSIVARMNLPDYTARRLGDYVGTLEASGCQVARIEGTTRALAAATLDAEIGRSVPLFVPADYQQEVHDYLGRALGLR